MTQYNVNPETGEVTKKQGEFEKKLDKKVDEVTKTKKKLGNPKAKVMEAAGGGLAEATAKLKAKGMSEGGSVVSIDTSPNSGLITTKGFGASRRT
jgi:hypothetical protein